MGTETINYRGEKSFEEYLQNRQLPMPSSPVFENPPSGSRITPHSEGFSESRYDPSHRVSLGFEPYGRVGEPTGTITYYNNDKVIYTRLWVSPPPQDEYFASKPNFMIPIGIIIGGGGFATLPVGEDVDFSLSGGMGVDAGRVVVNAVVGAYKGGELGSENTFLGLLGVVGGAVGGAIYGGFLGTDMHLNAGVRLVDHVSIEVGTNTGLFQLMGNALFLDEGEKLSPLLILNPSISVSFE